MRIGSVRSLGQADFLCPLSQFYFSKFIFHSFDSYGWMSPFPLPWSAAIWAVLRLAVYDAVVGRAPDVGEGVPVHPEAVHARVSGIPVVALDAQLDDVVRHGVLHATDVRRLRILHGEVLDRGSVRVVHIVAEQMRLRIELIAETLQGMLDKFLIAWQIGPVVIVPSDGFSPCHGDSSKQEGPKHGRHVVSGSRYE